MINYNVKIRLAILVRRVCTCFKVSSETPEQKKTSKELNEYISENHVHLIVRLIF